MIRSRWLIQDNKNIIEAKAASGARAACANAFPFIVFLPSSSLFFFFFFFFLLLLLLFLPYRAGCSSDSGQGGCGRLRAAAGRKSWMGARALPRMTAVRNLSHCPISCHASAPRLGRYAARAGGNGALTSHKLRVDTQAPASKPLDTLESGRTVGMISS